MKGRIFSVCLLLWAAVFCCLPGRGIWAAEAPSVSAQAAVVIEAVTGRVVFGQMENERLPMASTTKIMTALLTLEQPGLDEPFIVDPDAIRVEGSSMGLTEGSEVTLRTLAAGMLLASGNDAANAAAVKIAGSIPDFAILMNQRNSGFATPILRRPPASTGKTTIRPPTTSPCSPGLRCKMRISGRSAPKRA